MPSVSNLFEKLGLRWTPDADPLNAPDDALLRADNLIPDKVGALALRRGSTKVYTLTTTAADVHTLHTVELADGNVYRFQAAGDTAYINGVAKSAFDGTGDFGVADDAYQIFMARGKTKKKFDGINWNNWGLTTPQGVPTLAAVASISFSVAAFGNAESPACTIVEGSGSVGTQTGAAGDANGASLLQVDPVSNRATIQRLFATDQNIFTIGGVTGTSTDLFDVYLKMANPRNVQSIKVVFGLGTGTDPFVDDRFEFEFDLQNPTAIPIKDFSSQAYDAYTASVVNSLGSVRPQDVTGITTPDQIKTILANVGSKPSPTSAPPSDPSVWGHLTVTRGQFKRVGSTAGRGWDTVRGFKLIYTTIRGATDSIILDTAQMIGGGDQTLTGKYTCVIRAVRNFGQYYELSPPSAPSAPLDLNHQTLQITIPATMLSTIDPQADQLWIYLFGGWLDAYYRFAVVSKTIRGGATIDEFGTPSGGDMGTADKRTRITTWGFTVHSGAANADMVLTLLTGEMDALTENEKLEPYMIQPPDDIVAIAGPWKKRMFVLTKQGYVYPSTNRDPGSFNSAQVIDLTRYGHPRWIVKTNQGVVVGMEKDVVLLGGTGDDSVDLAQIDLYPLPYNVGNPPVDACRWVDGNAIIYRSVDGMVMLTGGNLQAIPMQGTSLLWRGYSRHGVPGLNRTTGRFRCAVANMMLYVLAAEGDGVISTNVIYRFATQTNEWSRLVYPQVGTWKSIFKEPDGTVVAGDDASGFWVVDVGVDDNGSLIPVNILTPLADGGNPLARKSPLDLQLHGSTGTSAGTVSIFTDSLASASATYPYTLPLIGDVYRIQVNGVGDFLRAQVSITGTFDTFSFYNLNLTYRVHPQHSVYIDTGYILPDPPGSMTWLYVLRLDVLSSVPTVIAEVWIDDALAYSTQVAVTPGVRGFFPVPIPRGIKGYRPRVIVRPLADGLGNVGFECYGIDAKMGSSGRQDNGNYRPIYPVGGAP